MILIFNLKKKKGNESKEKQTNKRKHKRDYLGKKIKLVQNFLINTINKKYDVSEEKQIFKKY